MCKELAAAPATALYLIENESGISAVAKCLQLLQESWRWNLHTTDTLYTFNDDGCNITLPNLGTHSINVTHGNECRVAACIYWRNNLWIVGNLNGKRCAAMESLFKSYHTLFSVLERREFERILICLGTGVYKEKTVILVTAYSAQLFSNTLLQGVDDGIGVETKRCNLTAYHVDIAGMGMTNGDDGMSAIEVEILVALVVPHLAALALDDIHIEERIYIVQIHCNFAICF